MPRVPTYDSPRVGSTGLPGVRQGGATPPVVDVAGPAARQTQMLGQGLMQAGGAMADIALQAQQEANQLRVDDAMNSARERVMQYTYDPQNGYMSIKGRDAMERESGKPLDIEYTDKLAEDLNAISRGLGNDAQRRAFNRYSTQALGQFQGQVMQHKASEYRTYRASVREGTIANRTNEIALNYNNPQAITEGINSIKAAVWDLGRMQGWAAEKIEAEQRQATSQAHRTALVAALQHNDLGYASAYFKQNMRDMDAGDILRIGGILQESNDLAAGRYAADTTFQRFAPQLAPSDMDRAFEIAVGTESGGQQFDANGQPLTSKAGAVGIAQVMPSTGPEAARLAGLPWDEERYRNDPDYNRALGRAYFGQQVKDFGGDLTKAYAAYNAGPGRLAGALKKADDNGHPDQWLQYLPAETRAYVTKNTREFAAGLGQAKPTLMEMKAQLREDPTLVGNPARLKAAENALESRYNDMTAALKQREDETLDTVYKTLYQNGGRMEGLDAGLRASIPGDKLGAVVEFAAKAAKGPTNDPAAWAEILSMPRAELATMSPADFFGRYRNVLDDTHMEKGYALLKDAQGNPDGSHLEILTTAQRVKQAAQAAKIIPDDNSKASADQLKAFGQFNLAIEDRVRQFEKVDLQGKRKANSEELQKIIDTALLDTVNVSRSYWRDKTDQPAVTLTPDQMQDAYVTVGDQEIKLATIPSSQRAQITAALRSRGRPVSEQAIASLWVAAGKPKD